MNFGIQTQNRFRILQDSDEMDCDKNQVPCSMNITMDDFVNASFEHKLNYMFEELRGIRMEQVNCGHRLASFEQSLTGMSEKLVQVANVTNSQSEFMKTLAYRSIDIEARSRRNNLIFRGKLFSTR